MKTEDRKKDHIELAFESSTDKLKNDPRFYYEPMFGVHPHTDQDVGLIFGSYRLNAPIWISSMTGGTELAKNINISLAKICHQFGLGMGLGSCRPLLENNERLSDFDVKKYMPNQPLYANLGIAQVADLYQNKSLYKIKDLINSLQADGLIVHINPLQEWFQPEGDKYHHPAIETIKHLLDEVDVPVFVKEVGQGFGPKSLEALLKLPIQGIELGGFGGTNFSKLESLRRDHDQMNPMIYVGQGNNEMIAILNDLYDEIPESRSKMIIISGGIKDFLTGYYFNNKCKYNSVYGQASSFLKYALQGYDELVKFTDQQIEGYKMASQFLTIK